MNDRREEADRDRHIEEHKDIRDKYNAKVLCAFLSDIVSYRSLSKIVNFSFSHFDAHLLILLVNGSQLIDESVVVLLIVFQIIMIAKNLIK